jgi:hypothetical protein
MKVAILLLFVVIACIDAKCPKCNADNCGDCLKHSNCVWCDERCLGKNEKIGCETRIEHVDSCPGDFNACIAALCPVGTNCEEDEDGNPVCIPFDPCSVVRCANGPCVVVDGEAQCTDNDNPCFRTDCADGLICILNDDGEAECVDNPCKWAKCSAGYTCQPNPDGSGSSCVPNVGCEYNGETYQEGESFDSIDGCNSCFCSNGQVGCTKMACINNCNADDDCNSEKQYCAKQSCNDDDQGYCTDFPEACDDMLNYVCGCDGETYSNECEAAREGVNVEFQGECEGGSQDTCTTHDDCKSDHYCKKDSCDDYSEGACNERSEVCLEIYAPVCGCDGKTYGNECEAAGAGVNIVSEGECEGGSQDDCESDNDCKSGYYCQKDSCDAQKGSCSLKSELCTLQFDPVCGCDGNTYGNDCKAAAAGVNIKSDGECEVGGGMEGECNSDDDCDEGFFCDYYNCAQDSGLCTENYGDLCASVVDPVCGCDGVTYNNDCERARAGVTRLLFRECPVCDPPCKDGESLCCPQCQGQTFCSDGSLAECPLFKCAA